MFQSKTAVFCDLVPCSLVDIVWGFRGAYYLDHQRDETSNLTSAAITGILLKSKGF
jgi:hypothetical protein